VFTLEGSVVRFRPVEPGLTQQASVEIVQGLKVGEKVVAMGASLLKDGDQVRLRGEGPPAGRGGKSGGSSPASKM
jgi:multidrug efflux pump subunit AcrA (membrane-fusion protein)